MLDWIFSPKDFLIKVQADLEDYRVPGVPNIANKYIAFKLSLYVQLNIYRITNISFYYV